MEDAIRNSVDLLSVVANPKNATCSGRLREPPLDQFLDCACGFLVEGRGGFIEHQDRGFQLKRPDEGDYLGLAPGEITSRSIEKSDVAINSLEKGDDRLTRENLLSVTLEYERGA